MTTKITNIAQLRARKGTVNALAETLGYYTASDGGGNTYQWNTSSVLADNGGSVIAVTGVATGRWIALETDTVNILQFGAKPDGVTNATTAIINAFALGKEVKAPKGTYLVNNRIEITNNFRCEIGAKFKPVTSYSGVLFNIITKDLLIVENLEIDAETVTGLTITGLLIEGLRSSLITNFKMLSAVGNTTNIGIDMVTSHSSTPDYGCYCNTIINPFIIRGTKGINTRQRSGDVVGHTHLNILGGWIGSQSSYNLHFNHMYNLVSSNIATDVVNNVGYRLENSHQIHIHVGEYNQDGVLVDVVSTSDFVNIYSPRNLGGFITGLNYTLFTPNNFRMRPTSVDANYYTEIHSDYNEPMPFSIKGKFGTNDERIILSYGVAAGLMHQGYPVIISETAQSMNGKTVNGVLLTTVGSSFEYLSEDGTYRIIDFTRRLNQKPGDYSLVTSDGGRPRVHIQMLSASPNVLTVPTHASQPIPVNEEIKISQYGTGQVTITPAGGVTIRSRAGMTKINGQHGVVYLTKLFDNEWLLHGDLTA